MARLLEHDALAILAHARVRLPRWEVAASVSEAGDAADRLGRAVVLKALVPVGGRGKAGAVGSAADAAEARKVAAELLGRSVAGYPVTRVLLMERLDIAEEHFVSITFDPACRGPVLLYSRAGGVDVERHAGEASALVRRPLRITRRFQEFEAREVALEAGVRGRAVAQIGELLPRLYDAFRQCDASLVEINPLAVTASGDVISAAAVIHVDDQALFRHPDLANRLTDEEGTGFRPFTALERRMREIDRADPHNGAMRFLEFPDGDIAFLVTSGGAALTALGQLVALGARPANAFDITAGQNEEKIYQATRALLSRPGLRGLIAGGNVKNFTRVDLQVRGIVRALKDANVDPRRFPVVLRFAGPGIEEAREIAREVPGLELYEDETSLGGAVRRTVDRTRAAVDA
jgi:succinyl-CoA synthetase beta subunit/citryl-CoA synthetase large subunit